MKVTVILLLVALCYVESKWSDNENNKEGRLSHLSAPDDYERQHGVAHRPHVRYNSEHEEHKHKERYRSERRDYSDKRHSENKYRVKTNVIDPPDHTELVPMARYVLHNADWASIATISTVPTIRGFPFSNVKSMADGYVANSTGIPYFYMSPLDFTARDLKENHRATVLATLQETKFCADKSYDPEDPRCTRVMLSGVIKKLRENSTEYTFAKGALFERHPSMASYPADHDFFVAKLKIIQIAMVDWFGGAKYIPVRDYLAFNYTEAAVNKLLKH